MSLLKRLFGAKSVITPVRKSLIEEIKKLESGRLNIEEQFTILILGPIETFGMRNGSPILELTAYTNDATLFELACFIVARAEFHLRPQSKDVKEEMLGLLHDRVKATFRDLLPDPRALHAIINDRLVIYRKVFETENQSAPYHELAHILRIATEGTPLTTSTTWAAMDWAAYAASPLGAMVRAEIEKWRIACLGQHLTDVLDQVSANLAD
jgi:hypothetical protein